ncbi:hypothetical protein [Paraclostridium dentum]|uniref:hypothetical protein n=1 Tax=Paraclostridium dentum TaxID=2662455 RepID=UPI003F32B3F4
MKTITNILADVEQLFKEKEAELKYNKGDKFICIGADDKITDIILIIEDKTILNTEHELGKKFGLVSIVKGGLYQGARMTYDQLCTYIDSCPHWIKVNNLDIAINEIDTVDVISVK